MADVFTILLYTWIVLELIAIIISLFGNAVVIYVMSREKKLRKKSSLYIVAIAITDFLTCSFIVPLIITRTEMLQRIGLGEEAMKIPRHCIWILSIAYSLTLSSVFQLLFVSLDRYWAICQPKFYLKRTKRFTKCVISICWIIGFLIGMTPVMTNLTGGKCNQHPIIYFIASSITVLSFVIIVVLYSLIFRAFRKQVK